MTRRFTNIKEFNDYRVKNCLTEFDTFHSEIIEFDRIEDQQIFLKHWSITRIFEIGRVKYTRIKS